jgi:deazaflavin-dependent oxidoreductase (nitroreductase family)
LQLSATEIHYLGDQLALKVRRALGRVSRLQLQTTAICYMLGGSEMANQSAPFMQPSALERLFNRAFGMLIRLGLGLPHNYLLEVRGRKSGKIYGTPVDVLTENGKRYLVAPRGYTQWVRNVQASGEVSLRKGGRVEHLRVRALSDAEKPPILKAYLDRFRRTVQRYFPVPTGSPVEAFVPLAPCYPVFELLPKN